MPAVSFIYRPYHSRTQNRGTPYHFDQMYPIFFYEVLGTATLFMVREGTYGYVPFPYPSTRYVYPVPVLVPDPWVRVSMQHSLTKFPCPMETKTPINSKNKWIYWDFFFVMFFFWHFVHSNVESLSCVFYIVGCDMIQTIPLYLW